MGESRKTFAIIVNTKFLCFSFQFGGFGGLQPGAPSFGAPLVSVHFPSNFRSLIARRKLQTWHSTLHMFSSDPHGSVQYVVWCSVGRIAVGSTVRWDKAGYGSESVVCLRK
jgi:hypothetical protein